MTTDYFNYKTTSFECACGWRGMGVELAQGEMFRDLCEMECPSCCTKLFIMAFPSFEECRANWDKLSELDRTWIEVAERRNALFERFSLKTAAQLPEIDDVNFKLSWDFADIPEAGSTTLIRHGERVIFSEPAFYEGYERFIEVAALLKERYGNALTDLEPTDASRLYLYGDRLSAPDQVARCRDALFGRKAGIQDFR